MRDEEVAQPVNGYACIQQLFGSAVTAIYDVRNIVDQKQCRGIAAARFADAWATFRAEEYDARLVLLAEDAAGKNGLGNSEGCGGSDKLSTRWFHSCKLWLQNWRRSK